jgi:hypothetical protein
MEVAIFLYLSLSLSYSLPLTKVMVVGNTLNAKKVLEATRQHQSVLEDTRVLQPGEYQRLIGTISSFTLRIYNNN